MSKKKYKFSFVIERILEYDDEDEEMIKAYGGAEFVEDMVKIDFDFAKEDPVTFFIDVADDWKEPTVEEIN